MFLWNCGVGPTGGGTGWPGEIWIETQLNEYDLCTVGKINKQKFADAIMLTYILLKLNVDPFLQVASPIIVNDW